MGLASSLQTAVLAAQEAIELADWATAIRKLTGAAALLIGIPNTKLGEEEIEYRGQVDGLLKFCRQQQASAAASASGGIQRSNITYQRECEE